MKLFIFLLSADAVDSKKSRPTDNFLLSAKRLLNYFRELISLLRRRISVLRNCTATPRLPDEVTRLHIFFDSSVIPLFFNVFEAVPMTLKMLPPLLSDISDVCLPAFHVTPIPIISDCSSSFAKNSSISVVSPVKFGAFSLFSDIQPFSPCSIGPFTITEPA